MSISPYNPNDRYRQRAARRLTKFLSSVLFLGMAFAAGFWVGNMRTDQNMYILKEDRQSLMEERNTMQEEMTELRAKAQTANVRLEQMRASYEELLSDGPMKDLVDLVHKQLAKGVDVKRLQSVILSARPPQNCSDPKNKRIVILTPVYSGPSSQASIAQGDILITGEGVSAQNSEGTKEAWFDPGQPVELTFKDSSGVIEKKNGVLPIYHSMVVGDKEYRFTVTAGAKSFAKITYDYCDYP